jgi:hypothetical protein
MVVRSLSHAIFKAQEYATLIGMRYIPPTTPSKPRPAVAPSAAAAHRPAMSHQSGASSHDTDKELAKWRNIAIGALVLASGAFVFTWLTKKHA